jgi:hypothetical protein
MVVEMDTEEDFGRHHLEARVEVHSQVVVIVTEMVPAPPEGGESGQIQEDEGIAEVSAVPILGR